MNILILNAERDVSRGGGGKFMRMNILDENQSPKTVTFFEDVDPNEIIGKVCEVEIKLQERFPPKITKLKVLEGSDPSVFYRKTELNRDDAINYLQSITRNNATLANIIDGILFDNEKIKERFKCWPAAHSMHHAFDGGLLEHTYSMAKNAEAIINTDISANGLDKDIIFCSIVLHDLGKVLEYEWKAPGPAKKSNRGLLLGHINIIDEMIVRECISNNFFTMKNPVLHLRHCLLSHHGKKEWGSSILPSTREAVFVHNMDLAQSKLQMAKEAIVGLEYEGFDYSRPLETNVVNFSNF